MRRSQPQREPMGKSGTWSNSGAPSISGDFSPIPRPNVHTSQVVIVTVQYLCLRASYLRGKTLSENPSVANNIKSPGTNAVSSCSAISGVSEDDLGPLPPAALS